MCSVPFENRANRANCPAYTGAFTRHWLGYCTGWCDRSCIGSASVARPPRSTRNSSVAHPRSRRLYTWPPVARYACAAAKNEVISCCQTHSLYEGMISQTSCSLWLWYSSVGGGKGDGYVCDRGGVVCNVEECRSYCEARGLHLYTS